MLMTRSRQIDNDFERLFIPVELSDTVLPSYWDVINYYEYLHKTYSDLTYNELVNNVAVRVESLWSSLLVPIILTKSISNKIKNFHAKYDSILEAKRKRKNSAKLQDKILEFMSVCRSLFDIAKCQCDDVNNCFCEKESKLPESLTDFLKDQRNDKSMNIMQALRKLKKLPRIHTTNELIEPQMSDLSTLEENFSQVRIF